MAIYLGIPSGAVATNDESTPVLLKLSRYARPFSSFPNFPMKDTFVFLPPRCLHITAWFGAFPPKPVKNLFPNNVSPSAEMNIRWDYIRYTNLAACASSKHTAIVSITCKINEYHYRRLWLFTWKSRCDSNNVPIYSTAENSSILGRHRYLTTVTYY